MLLMVLSGLAFYLLLGESSLIPRGLSSGVIETAKAWECFILQEKYYKDRVRSREHGSSKDSKRGRHRDGKSFSSLYKRWVSLT